MPTTVIRCACALASVVIAAAAAVAETTKLKTVTARSIELRVPESWKSVKVTSRMRAAQLVVPGETADDQSADLVVYYFGGATGGIKANIDRWIGQFRPKGRTVELVRGKSEQGDYFLVDISGTCKKPDGPPFAQKTIDKPGSRVISVILATDKDNVTDYYFIKFSGPDALVKSQAATLRTAFGADPESEKPFSLDDADS